MSRTPVRDPRLIAEAASIALQVCTRHGVTAYELLSHNRRRPVVKARQEVMWRLWRELHLSLPQVGSLLNRDHTTVLHALDQQVRAGRS